MSEEISKLREENHKLRSLLADVLSEKRRSKERNQLFVVSSGYHNAEEAPIILS